MGERGGEVREFLCEFVAKGEVGKRGREMVYLFVEFFAKREIGEGGGKISFPNIIKVMTKS